MYCRNCGFQVKETSKFCANCGNAINRNQAAKRNIKTPSVRIFAVIGIIVFIIIILIAVENNNKRKYSPYIPYTQNGNITQQQTQSQTQSQSAAENQSVNPPVSNYDYNNPFGLSNILDDDIFGNPYYDPNNPYMIDIPSPNSSGSSSGNSGGPISICSYCNGTGQILAGWSTDYTGTSVRTWCAICNEFRYPHYHKTCTSCNGSGRNF